MILPGQSNRESLPVYKVTFLSVSVQIQRLLRGGIERVALLWLTDWLCDTLLTFLRAISVPFQHTSNTDLMCTLLRRANMGGEYCFFLPIKPQRIKEHSPPSQPIPTSPLTPCYPQSGECGETWRSVQESGAEYRSAARGELMPRLFSIRNWPLAQKTLLCDQHRPQPPPLLTGICHDIIFWLGRLQSYKVMSALNHDSRRSVHFSAAVLHNKMKPLWAPGLFCSRSPPSHLLSSSIPLLSAKESSSPSLDYRVRKQNSFHL